MTTDMRRRTILLVSGTIFAWIASLPAAGRTPFERVAIDDSIKDPWAKIIADIDKDGFADIVIGG